MVTTSTSYLAESGSAPHDARDPVALRWRYAAAAAIVLGVVIRLWQYFANPSIWVDEAAIARNVLDRDLWALLAAPLDYGQVAPPGWLAIVDTASVLLGTSEFALRLLPLVGGILTLPAVYVLAMRVTTAPGAVLTTLLVALAVPLVLFSANVKPYATDVLIAVAIVILVDTALRVTLDRRGAVWLSAAGALGLTLSNAAVFVVVPAGVLLALSRRREPDASRRTAVAAVWALAVLVTVAWGLRSMTPVDSAYMQLFWRAGFGPEAVTEVPVWMWDRLNMLFGRPGGSFQGNLKYPTTEIVVAFVLIGAATLCVRDAKRAALMVGPLLLAIGAALVGRYPFQGRLIMFLIPFLLLLGVVGVEVVVSALWRPAAVVAPWLLLIPAAQAFSAYPVPQTFEHIRPVLERIQAERQPGDKIWVYYGGGSAFRYYQHRLQLDGVVSVCDRGNSRGQLEQIDAMRGSRRVWVVITHTGANGLANERTSLVSYLDAIGTRLAEFPDFADRAPSSAAFGFLYDLSDERKLQQATAQAVPVPASRATQWSCYGTMTPDLRNLEHVSAAVIAAAAR